MVAELQLPARQRHQQPMPQSNAAATDASQEVAYRNGGRRAICPSAKPKHCTTEPAPNEYTAQQIQKGDYVIRLADLEDYFAGHSIFLVEGADRLREYVRCVVDDRERYQRGKRCQPWVGSPSWNFFRLEVASRERSEQGHEDQLVRIIYPNRKALKMARAKFNQLCDSGNGSNAVGTFVTPPQVTRKQQIGDRGTRISFPVSATLTAPERSTAFKTPVRHPDTAHFDQYIRYLTEMALVGRASDELRNSVQLVNARNYATLAKQRSEFRKEICVSLDRFPKMHIANIQYITPKHTCQNCGSPNVRKHMTLSGPSYEPNTLRLLTSHQMMAVLLLCCDCSERMDAYHALKHMQFTAARKLAKRAALRSWTTADKVMGGEQKLIKAIIEDIRTCWNTVENK